MENEKPKVKVVSVHTNEALFTCDMDQAEKAYQFMASMEELGLELKVITPTLSQTLTSALGLSIDEQTAYEDSLIEEIEQHDGSCCGKSSVSEIITQ